MAPLSTTMRVHNNRPTLFLDDTPALPYLYALTDSPGGRLSFEEYPAHSIRKFVDAGVRLFQLDVWFDDMWSEDGAFDPSICRRQIRGVLDLCPDAAVFLRFHVTPPKWWNRRCPEECVEFADVGAFDEEAPHDFERYLERDNTHAKRHSFASERWVADASEKLALALDALAASPEGDRLAGVQPATGVYGEHHYWGFMEHEPDVSPVMTAAFRRYLAERYGGDFPDALVPGVEERQRTSDGIFRDPELERTTIDYYAFQHRLVAERVVHFCRLVKERWPREIVTGAFYGYYFSLFGRASTGGHLSEEIVLGSPHVDYLSAPQAYTRSLREVGGAGTARGLLDSVRLNGKLWLDEMDQPTHRGTLLGGMPVYDLDRSVQILRRNIASPFVRGQGLWFYDFGPHNHSGWWNHARYQAEVREMRRILDARATMPYDNASDALLVYDTKTRLLTAHTRRQDPLTEGACADIACPAAYRSGAAFDVVYLSDLEKVDLDRYACVAFMNAFAMSAETREIVRRRVLRDGRNVFWVYAPGYSDFTRNSVDFVTDLTGFDLERVALPDYTVRTDAGEYGIGELEPGHRLAWALSPRDADEVHGTFVSGGRPAIGVKRLTGHTSWFFSMPPTTAEVLRRFFRAAGVHVYNEYNDSLLEGGGLLVLHSAEGGPRSIALRSGRRVELDVEPAETIVLDSATGRVLRRGT